MKAEKLIEALGDVLPKFNRARRTAQLAQISIVRLTALIDPKNLRAYHDLLLFLTAYPDDVAVQRLVTGELRRLAGIVKKSTGRRGLATRLVDSGIAHTDVVHGFTLDITRWLTRRAPRHVEFDWEDGSLGEALDEFLHQLVPTVERDGLYADHLSTQEWFALARGGAGKSDVSWLVDQFERLGGPASLRDHAFDSLHLAVRWKLRYQELTRTFVRFPARPLFSQREPILRQVDLRTLAGHRLQSAKPTSRRIAEKTLDACRTTLCVRHREIDTLTWVNPSEVALFQLERGIDVAVFGMSPERRLPIESYFGFVVARNRVPIGYGGGWVFFERCEIGVNIFDEFRGAESAYAFAQVIRVYHQYFRTTRFLVDPFQFGAGNREAITSGAFWFYYRLGFRPIDAKLRQLADYEAALLAENPRYRTPAVTLRKLARAKLEIDLSEDDPSGLPVLDLTQLGLALTGWIGRRFRGDRARAERQCSADVMRMLRIAARSQWTADKLAAFRRMSLLVAPLDAIRNWSLVKRTKLSRVLRAKGGLRERDYALGLQRLPELRDALLRFSESGRSPPPVKRRRRSGSGSRKPAG